MNENKSLEALISRSGPIILDGGIGTELERLGAPMDHEAWCAVALETHPQLVRDVHRSYIDVGADIITVNTYAATRHALTNGGMEDNFISWNKRAVQLARDALDTSEVDRNILIAGSVSNFGHFDTPIRMNSWHPTTGIRRRFWLKVVSTSSY